MRRGKVDYVLAGAVTFLLLSGLIMVFSASSMMAITRFDSLFYFFKKQVMWGILAFIMMISFSRIDYRKLNKNKFPLMLIGFTILLLAGLPFLGVTVNGAKRWYSLGFFNFQPSELAKFSLILYFAHFLSSRGDRLRDFKSGLLPLVTILSAVLVLIMIQPDLSTSLMISMVAGSLLFLSRAKIRHIIALMLPLVPMLIYVFTRKGYQLHRVTKWIEGWDDPVNASYQIKQSLIGLGRGGWFGNGLGQSKQKNLFLPDSHTDFIFSIIGEEFGYIGTTIVLIVFLVIFFRGLRLATKVPDAFGRYLALGITLNIVLFAFINSAVVSMLVPATGLPMPFISYGGSNLLFLGVSIGILLSISRVAGPAGATTYWNEFEMNRNQLFHRVMTAD